MKHFLLTLLFALVSATSFAAEPDSIAISGNVLDAFTREYLDSVNVEMYELPAMRLVQKTMIYDWINRYDDPDQRKDMERWNPPVRRRVYNLQGVPGTYLLCFSCKGYQDKEEQITIPPKRYGRPTETWEVKDVLLDRDHTRHLDEAVVNATKIKMFTKGDTLVYNADAFQVADGSMLDGLIAMMPGLEIRDGGKIYHNGEYVPELLLNGKDFFNGDPAIALKNLPAYTVKDLRIYHKAPDGAYLRKDLTQSDTLSWNKVLDVRLKKQYSHGWITNAEVAAGPAFAEGKSAQDVWLARLFGLHFSDHTRLGVFANINNINDTGLANNQGDWNSSWTPEPGVTTMQLGALDFTVDGKKTKINYNTNVQAVREVSDTQSETSATTFLPSGDVFNRSRYSTNYDRFHFVWANNIKWDGKKASFTFRPGLDFFRKTYDTESLSAQFGPTPNPSPKGRGEVTTPFDSLYVPLYLVSTPLHLREGQGVGPLVNNVNSTLHRTTDTWTQSANLYTYFTDPKFGRPVSIVFSQSYTHETPHETQRYALTQLNGNTFENRSTLTPTSSFSLWGSFEYSFHKWGILASDLRYSYSKNYRKYDRERYVQDFSDESLPSNLQTFDLDLENSFNSTRNRDSHDLSLPFDLNFTDDFNLKITPSLQHTRDYYADTRGQIGEATRHSTFFLPSASLSYHYRPLGADSLARKTAHLGLRYNFYQSAPDALYTLAIRDSSDPLRITLGNPNLNNSYTHALNFYHYVSRKSSSMSSALSYSRRQQQIAQAMSYNAETGVYTYRPENVDGNWNVSGNFSYNTTLGNSPFGIYTYTTASYGNSVDLISPDGLSDAVRSEVHNTKISERLEFGYSHKNISARLYGSVQWNYATSERLNFTTRSTFDCYYGATLNANNFLWGLSFSTDLALRQRRGYDDASMNDNNLVWDAQLSRSFGKSKSWNVSLKGHDLLRQLSNVTRTLNAQGLTETWTNSLPSFLMLHVSYRWNKKPKK
ncbi:MAG: outer membrane beta-barrel protein [Bacteroidales bacterium]|nr:outer membrane beta-barrel protein [Bacteroidales bacterium]